MRIFMSFIFLISEPVINQYTFILIAGWLFLVLGFLCTSSLYPAMKAIEKTVVKAFSAT